MAELTAGARATRNGEDGPRPPEAPAGPDARAAFVANAAHELRTPLTLVRARLETFPAREPGLSLEGRREIDRMIVAVDRLADTVGDMLDFGRMEAGGVVPDLRPVDVPALLRELAATFAPAMDAARLGFETSIDELPGPALADRHFVERIVVNLLSNALKFTPAGGCVALRLRTDRDAYVLEVADTGIGIEEADQARVFRRFQQVRPRPGARSAGGAGIGLTMVADLAALLGGTVALRSSPDAGSTFTVRLPLDAPGPLVEGRSLTPRKAASFLAEFEPDSSAPVAATAGIPRLLLVEDSAETAGLLCRILADSYQVTAVHSGEIALAAMSADPPNLLLADVSLPGMDGCELVRRVRADPALRTIPVVLLSARATTEDAATGLACGADDYLVKPFSVLELKARLAANLTRARERVLDAAWRRAVIRGIRDAVLVWDREGTVLEVNDAFTQLLGYRLSDGPLTPPYPWWPTEEEDPAGRAALFAAFAGTSGGADIEGEFRMFRKDRTPVWVSSTGAVVTDGESGRTAYLRCLRDITREKRAQERRAEAARISRDFARNDDLATLLGVAMHGFSVLFGGIAFLRFAGPAGEDLLVGDAGAVAPGDLPAGVAAHVVPASASTAGTEGPVPGILILPGEGRSDWRSWVQFDEPRMLGTDELIVSDMLAQSFSLALDRARAAAEIADTQAQLRQGIESHRLIGQAVGILVERHRILPATAFERIKGASRMRNIKVREIAQRIIDTGLDPEEA